MFTTLFLELLALLDRRVPAVFKRREAPRPDRPLNGALVDIPLDERQHNRTDEFSFVLKASAVKGVGVFATHGIARGTELALFPIRGLRFISREKIRKDARLEKFCQFYGVEKSTGSYVASSFGGMSVGWYLNHSETPNAEQGKVIWYKYRALRDIVANEEITIDYRTL